MLGKRLKELRNLKQLTQDQIAKKLHLTRSTYAQYEVERRVPEYATLEKLANFFEVSIDYLVGREMKDAPNEDIELNEEQEYVANLIINIEDPVKKQQAIAYLEFLANSPTDGAKK